jgi:hypothetical protein
VKISCAAASCGEPQRRRSGATVILGQGGHSALRSSWNRGFFNLQASMPRRRPFRDSITALFVTPSPSGLVPGAGAGGRDVELVTKLRWRRAQGLDCFFQNCLGVLCVNKQVLVVFFHWFWTCLQIVIPPL